MKTKFLPLLGLAAIALPASLSATTIPIVDGSFFNITATLTVTNATNPTITLSNASVPNQGVVTTPVGGTFLTANGGGSTVGQTMTVQQLIASSEPVGTAFSDPNWLSFVLADNLPTLTLTYIVPGVDGTAGCTSTPPAGGQVCTPTFGSSPSIGPFNFQNTDANDSSASFTFKGITADGLDSFTAAFTSQFTVPFQTVLANLAAGGVSGSVSNSISGTVTFTTIPEPGSFVLMGVGLLLIAMASTRIRRRA